MLRSINVMYAAAEGWAAYGAAFPRTQPCPLPERMAFLIGEGSTWTAAPFTLAFNWGTDRQTAQALLRRDNELLWTITYTWDGRARGLRRHLIAANGAFGSGVERAVDDRTTETIIDLTLPDGEPIRFIEIMTRIGENAFTTETTHAHSPDGTAPEIRHWVRAG